MVSVSCFWNLKGHRLFKGVADSVVAVLLSNAVAKTYKAKAGLLEPGEAFSDLLVVYEGWVKAYRLTEEGTEAIPCLYGPGRVVLPQLIFSEGGPPVGLAAETKTRVVAIPLKALHEAMSTDFNLCTNLLRETGDVTQELVFLLQQVSAKEPVARVAGFLLQMMITARGMPVDEFELPLRKRDIATHLGVTPETFSRCLKQLGLEGISFMGSRVSLNDGKDLCPYCDPLLAAACGKRRVRDYCRLILGLKPEIGLAKG